MKKISIVTGSTWAWERNATTLRPVSSSITSVKFVVIKRCDDHVVDRVRLGFHRPTAVRHRPRNQTSNPRPRLVTLIAPLVALGLWDEHSGRRAQHHN
jgi:hypothetical protein